MNQKNTNTVSKFLSLVLRHQPELIGIELDNEGWVDVATLISQVNAHGTPLDMALLERVVETNSKKRFAFDEGKGRIRASQGHSVAVELGYEPQTPPEILFHGTTERFLNSILSTGLEKRQRQHVHLSQDHATAMQVGARHGKPFILTVLAAEMHAAGHVFYLSANNVWLTDHVPVQYLKYLPEIL
ncbi:RNA 2'-phosphotransferase [Pedobacter sp. GR22-6]|uniref:RNA 2'-phosphotransferase n=1 Tax=Pedobacter sp. GR22-6 TaxID=3127957 RepID=UPI00307F6636